MTHPSVYQQEIDQILSKCVKEINYVLQTHFKGHYKHNKNHEFIKLQTIFGTPCFTEMRSNQYGIEYKSGLWGKKDLVACNDSWCQLPDNEILNVYSTLYKIVYENQ